MLLALQSLVGIVAIPLIAWAISENHRHYTLSRLLIVVVSTLLIQLAIALLLLKVPASRFVFDGLGSAVIALQRATETGTQLVFGYLAGGPAPFDVTKPQNSFIVAFSALPLILVFSALSRLFYHWGILQRIVAGFAFLLQRATGTGGPLATASAATVFLGIVEAPLMIRPYLKDMGRGALFATMVTAMATIAGTMMTIYASILAPYVPGAAGHLLAASIMNVPAALMLSRLAVPEGFEGGPEKAKISIVDDPDASGMDAVAKGTIEGINLVVTVAAMLIVVVALVALTNSILGLVGTSLGVPITLQGLLGIVCAPLAWAIGIPWSEAATAGALLGQKAVLNEFLAYLDMAKIPDAELSARSRLILTYAMCSFANLGSLGILIGGLTAMAPERRAEIVALAPRSVFIGFFATLLSAAVIGAVSWQ